LAGLVQRITRNFGEENLTDPFFLDVAKAFDTVWVNGLLYKLTPLNFPSYIVHAISSYLWSWTIEGSLETASSSRRGMWSGVAQGELISPVLFSLYVNDMPTPSHPYELPFYAEDTTITAAFRKPTGLTSTWNHNSTTFNGG
jgi:hypothetical protein